MKHKVRLIIIGLIIFFTTLLIGTYETTKAVNSFFNERYLKFNKVISVTLKYPFEIKAREKAKVVEKKIILDYPDEIDTPIEQYICEKFGAYDCKTALAVFKAESGLREDAVNINTNGTIDVGIAQINSVHFKKPGCSLKEIADMYKNVDCAYTIWKASGWSPWVAFNKGSYLSHL